MITFHSMYGLRASERYKLRKDSEIGGDPVSEPGGGRPCCVPEPPGSPLGAATRAGTRHKGDNKHDSGSAGNQQGNPGTGTPDRDPAEWTKLSETSGEPQHRGSDGTAENVMLQIWAGTKQEFWKRGIE